MKFEFYSVLKVESPRKDSPTHGVLMSKNTRKYTKTRKNGFGDNNDFGPRMTDGFGRINPES